MVSLKDDLIAARAKLPDARSAQDACSAATGDITGGEPFRAVLAAITDDRTPGWISRAFDRAIAAAEPTP